MVIPEGESLEKMLLNPPQNGKCVYGQLAGKKERNEGRKKEGQMLPLDNIKTNMGTKL